jgi:DNA-binding transcriptional regulator YhcF (GntR family)
MPEPQSKPPRELRRIEQRWGKALAYAGWTPIPSTFLIYQSRLGLDALDFNIIMQIAKHWWEPGKLPFPSKKLIADQIGVTPRTVQRRITSMVKAGLLSRVERRDPSGGNKSNEYAFDGLRAKAEPHAMELLKERAERRRVKSERSKPRRLRAVG